MQTKAYIPVLAAVIGEVTSSSNFSNFSEFLLSILGLGAFAGGETFAGAGGAAALLTGSGRGATDAENSFVDDDDGAATGAILDTLMNILPWYTGRALLSSVTSIHTI